jgi:tetratricopeptide (TPR) repeat protein
MANSYSVAKPLGWSGLVAVIFIAVCAQIVTAQGPCGGKPCPRIVVITRSPVTSAKPASPTRTTNRSTGSGRRGSPPPRPPKNSREDTSEIKQPPEPESCQDSDLVVVCGMSGCEITLNGQEKHVTDDLGGFTFQVAGNQSYKVRVTRPGYDSYERTEPKLECGDQRIVNATLNAKPVMLKIRTLPAECDIYLDNQKQPKGSDAQGLFSYLLTKPTLLLEARKQKYLSKTRSIVLKPELANSEIVLALEPLPATVKLSVNIESAQITIDNHNSPIPFSDRLSLPPGTHTLSIEALGYAPDTFHLNVGPDETVSREVKLERLPTLALQSQAANLLAARAYTDVLKLCSYILEADNSNAVAHRLEGYVYLARGDFGNASAHFAQALAGNESVALQARHHPGEKFDLVRGHDMCEARLIFRKNEIEFQGLRNPVDNFKVSYDQIQVVGIQVKNSVAVYLGTKVTVAGKRRDYNFFAYDKELSQSGKPYLEMIQGLLRSH